MAALVAAVAASCFKVSESDVARSGSYDTYGQVSEIVFQPAASAAMVKEWQACHKTLPCLRTGLGQWDFNADPSDRSVFLAGIDTDEHLQSLVVVLGSVEAGDAMCASRQTRVRFSTSVPVQPTTPAWRALAAGTGSCAGADTHTTTTRRTTSTTTVSSTTTATTTTTTVPAGSGPGVSGTTTQWSCGGTTRQHTSDLCYASKPATMLVTASRDGVVLASVQSGADGTYALALSPGDYDLAPHIPESDRSGSYIRCDHRSVTVTDSVEFTHLDLICSFNFP